MKIHEELRIFLAPSVDPYRRWELLKEPRTLLMLMARAKGAGVSLSAESRVTRAGRGFEHWPTQHATHTRI